VKRLLYLPIVLLVALGALAADPPLLQPSSYLPQAQVALQSGIDAIAEILGAGYPVTHRQLENRGWDDTDFMWFVAGTITSFGYQVKIVSVDDWNGEPHAFILVGIDLGDDGTAWIPVEADPSFLNSFWLLGAIPWADEGSMTLDSHYLSYDRVLEEVKVSPPDISLIVPGAPVIDSPAAITVIARGRSIIAYQWSIDGGDPITSISPSIWQTFTEAGEHTVSVTVIDELGGRAEAQGTFEVLEKRHQCHCSNP